MDIKTVSDKELLDRTKMLVKEERSYTLEIIKHLEEIFRRRLFTDLGYSSLFDYCTRHLGYSPAQAQRRINASRLIHDLPEVESLIKSGRVTLSNASQLQSFVVQEEKGREQKMDRGQKRDLLLKIADKSAREAERILAEQSSLPTKIPKELARHLKNDRVEIRFSLKGKEYREMCALMDKFNLNNMEELIIKLKDLAYEKEVQQKVKEEERLLKAKTDKTKADSKESDLGAENHRPESNQPKSDQRFWPAADGFLY